MRKYGFPLCRTEWRHAPHVQPHGAFERWFMGGCVGRTPVLYTCFVDELWRIVREVLPAVAPLLFGLAVGLLGFLFARVTARKRLRKLLPAFEPGTATLTGGLLPRVEGIFAGYTFRYRVRPKSNNNPGGAELKAKIAQTACRWSARRMDSVGKVLLRLGAVDDVQIGEEVLDARLHFSTSEPLELRSLLSQRQAREELHRLAATSNFQSIQIKTDWVHASWSPRNPKQDEDPEVLQQRMQAVANLLASLSVPPGL